ncbi:hypothetical protein JR316_0006523 [Psilocybe cubensis]|uniref:DUF6534 domain-containing protein n=2 Tax=Psilocybe cubensis TaxID=181762 RepID=A0A8H8CEF2_PSICU|nr:hypothetical protein JR316_0006523 [Psilocybe cubensis]KAH9481993.1 hypothetical protein JR316_0006523 [Psilocybe cubensis]
MAQSGLPVVKIAGPLFLSLLFNFAGFGVLTVQVYLYFLAFPNDPLRSRSIVYSVYTLELVQTVLIARTLYDEFVFGFLDVDSLDRIGEIWFAVPIAGGIVTFIVQSFYVHRIVQLGHFLGRRRVIAIACGVILVSFAQMAAGFTLGVQMFQVSLYSKVMVPEIQTSAGIWYAGGAICDIVIAVCMTSILLRSSDGITPRTRKIVRRLIRLTVEAGSLTAAMGIITIAFVLMPSPETYYQTSAAILSKLYSNTMMVVLNSRMELSSRETDTQMSLMSGVKFATRMPVRGQDGVHRSSRDPGTETHRITESDTALN